METLEDIKKALNKIPDNVLSKCQFGIGENTEETISLIYMDDNYLEIFEKYPELVQLNNLIENIKKAQEVMDNQDEADKFSEDLEDRGITDTFFDKKK